MKDLQKKLRMALVQATPVMFNKDATINKVCAQIREAGENGAELIVFPESLIPCYPYGLTYGFTVGSRTEECRDDWKIYYDNAVPVRIPTASARRPRRRGPTSLSAIRSGAAITARCIAPT